MLSSTKWDRARLVCICLALSFAGNFQYAFSTTYTNTAIHSFRIFLNDTNGTSTRNRKEERFSFVWNVIVNIWFPGFLPGLWVARVLTDKYGRKLAFLVGNTLNVMGSILRCVAIAIHFPGILIGARALCGFATAISYCSLILYLQEVAPSSIRGMTSCLNGVVYALIAFLCITLGNDSFLGKNLLYYLASAILPCIISVVVVALLPETPKFLVSVGEHEKAFNSTKFYHGESANIEESLKAIKKDVGEVSSDEAKFSDLFTRKHLRAALLLFLASLQNTVSLWTILFSSTFYLESTGVEYSLAQWSSSMMAGAFLVGTISGAVLIDRCGRRKIMIYSNVTNMASLSLYVLFAETSSLFEPIKYGCPVMLIIFGFTYGNGVGPVARFIGSELVTQRYRSLITAFGFAWDTVMSGITAFSCGPLFSLMGPNAFLVLFVGPSILYTFYLGLFLPETKGREVEEVVNILKKQSILIW